MCGNSCLPPIGIKIYYVEPMNAPAVAKDIRKPFKGKALYQPSGKAAEYSPWAVNFYTGCSNDCDYCYCKRGVMSHVWDNKPHLKKCFKNEEAALRTLCKEIEPNLNDLRKKGILFSFTTDPLLPETRVLTFASMASANYLRIPVKVLSKRADFLYRIPEYLDKKLVAFGFTLTGSDELEPGASSNQERIEAMRALNKMGFKTWASIEPVISVEKSLEMIKSTLGFCDLYKVGLMSGVKNNYYDPRDFYDLIIALSNLSNEGVKIYPKDSLIEAIGSNREILNDEWDANFVKADYNIFNSSNFKRLE